MRFIAAIHRKKNKSYVAWIISGPMYQPPNRDSSLRSIDIWIANPQRCYQGSQRSAWFEFPDFSVIFPDFPWPHGTNLTSIAWKSKWSEKNICTYNHIAFKNMSRNIYDKIWFTLARSKFSDFPWLSIKNIEIPWLSRRKYFSLTFPDFSWRWEPYVTLPLQSRGWHNDIWRDFLQVELEGVVHWPIIKIPKMVAHTKSNYSKLLSLWQMVTGTQQLH